MRLAARLEVDGDRPPDPSELARELDRVKADLAALVGAARAPGARAPAPPAGARAGAPGPPRPPPPRPPPTA